MTIKRNKEILKNKFEREVNTMRSYIEMVMNNSAEYFASKVDQLKEICFTIG